MTKSKNVACQDRCEQLVNSLLVTDEPETVAFCLLFTALGLNLTLIATTIQGGDNLETARTIISDMTDRWFDLFGKKLHQQILATANTMNATTGADDVH